jgi:hypothetical protein
MEKGLRVFQVAPSVYSTLKAYSSLTKEGIKVTLPARSLVFLVVDKK